MCESALQSANIPDNIYLDHAGTTLYNRLLVDRFAADMTARLLGNPHSASASSQAAAQLVEDVRLRTLQFFRADPAEFDLVFVANATAGVKLVAEAFRALPSGFSYAYHQACHTSLVGVREEAAQAACLSSDDVEAWVSTGRHPAAGADCLPTLFAYPAQSNMDGQRFPLSWAHRLRRKDEVAGRDDARQVWTLLDAAAYASTSPLDLSDPATAPDFTVVSFYKIFGFPDLGALIVRRPAEPLFDARRYFGGGTVEMVVCSPREQWHAPKGQSLHDRLEDGTLPVHSIAALDAALDTHAALFGSMARVAAHAGFLADRLCTGLAALQHRNSTPVCRIYSPTEARSEHGPVIAFNLQNAHGAWVSLTEFDKLATLRKFHIRTGGVCNPGGVAAALGLEPWEVRRNFSHGVRCGSEESGDIVSGKPTGIIRVSLAAMSTISDVDCFLAFLDEFYRDGTVPQAADTSCQPLIPPSSSTQAQPNDGLVVSSISVYPIKSCGAFSVPPRARWEVRPEGLAWDREWCLMHRGTRRALSQKQYPQMTLLRPTLDFESGMLRVAYAGQSATISVPLSHNPAMYKTPFSSVPTSSPSSTTTPPRSRAPRVCGEEIAAQVYTSDAVNDFFSEALGVPCLLARFPPGGQGKSMRHAKAHLQKHQIASGRGASSRGSGDRHTALPSPPDSDSERANSIDDNDMRAGVADQNGTPPADASTEADGESARERQRRRILLSNESPVLAINMASVRALNDEIQQRNGSESQPIDAAVFLANIVLDAATCASAQPYAEDGWSRLRIGHQTFKMLGACRRCHMVCINQETGAKSEEPFVTLTKTRRFDGKVFFGTHMGHDPEDEEGPDTLVGPGQTTRDRQFPTIMVGDPVAVE